MINVVTTKFNRNWQTNNRQIDVEHKRAFKEVAREAN